MNTESNDGHDEPAPRDNGDSRSEDEFYRLLAQIPEERVNNSKRHSNSAKHTKKHWVKWASFGISILAALVAAVAAGFNGWQGWTSRDTEKRELRPYVYASPNVAGVMANSFPFVSVDMKNGGETPAYSPLFGMEWLVLPYPQTINLKAIFGNPFHVRAFIYKDHDLEESVPPGIGTPITKSSFTAIQKGTAAIYIFGAVEYQDAFENWHQTYFCFVMRPQNFSPGGSGYGYCDADKGNNDAN